VLDFGHHRYHHREEVQTRKAYIVTCSHREC